MMQIRYNEVRRRLALWGCLLLGLLVILAAALWVCGQTGANLMAHSAFDSYAKQAMAWRDGRVALDQNYPWLELAIYRGEYYVSFPPVPAVPQWILSFWMGEETPSGLLTLLYFLGAYIALYFLLNRYLRPGRAMLCAVFIALGGSALDLAVSGDGFSGGVWFQAQMLGLLLTAVAFCCMDSPGSRAAWVASLVCIALAVGCRPFNALYVPVLLWMLHRNLGADTFLGTVRAMLPYVLVPALIAVLYGVYNAVRFGNPIEFGHAYLPELEQAGEGMFVPARLGGNIRAIFRPMTFTRGLLTFPIISGFAVYLTNPLIFFSAGRTLERTIRRRADRTDLLLCATLLLHAALLLMHRTNGGWQYGTRYLCDLLPALALLFARGRLGLRRAEAMLMGFLIALNLYGTVIFHTL